MRMKERKSIVFDAERLKYPYTGLYTFCLSLGKALTELQTYHQIDPLFYVPSTAKGLFGSTADYLIQKNTHKIFLPKPQNIALWHATHQQTDYFPFKTNIPVLLTVHDLNFLYDQTKNEKKKQKYLHDLQQKIKRATAIVTVSAFTADELAKNIDLGTKKPTIIYNGIDTQITDENHAPTYIPTKPFIFSIGTIVPKKNFHVLPQLLKNNNYELIIAGIVNDVEYKKQIIAEAQQLGVANRLQFTGTITDADKIWYYKHALCLAFPSLAEGFGLPVVEAMHWGTPLLLSQMGSIPEIAGDAGVYITHFEADHMQAQLAYLLQKASEPDYKDDLKNRAEKYTWQAAATKYMELYEELIS